MKSAATQAGFYGVTKDGCTDPIQKGAGFEVYRTIAGTENRIYGNDINRRRKLKEAVESQGFDQVIEETAYTWFNRLIAIRFMEVNGYLPTRTRVLSSETGSNTPDLVAQYLDVDLGMSDEEIEKVARSIKDNRYDDAFALLFVKQCNALNELLPKLFEKTDDYMELLLKLSYTGDGVVRMLVDTIPESDFNVDAEGQVEIIGWLYQYYNTEPKNEAFAKKSKITKKEVPAVTQLFTPDWIVRYMVENSLGRLWYESHSEQDLIQNWNYYLEEPDQDDTAQSKLDLIRKMHAALNPEDIKIIDPCMGSGHILVYAFDVLVKIYEEQGYATRDIPQLILENNLFGLDIDDRAAQMAYFSVMMKACQYNRRFLRKNVSPKIFAIQESNAVNRKQLSYFGSNLSQTERTKALSQINDLLDAFVDAKEYGSILNIKLYDWGLLRKFVEDMSAIDQISMDTIDLDVTQKKIKELLEIACIIADKYHVVCTNPPYMAISNGSTKLNNYVKKYYPDSKTDLFAVLIEKCISMTLKNCYTSMITQHSWMFIATYEKLRKKVQKIDYVNMIHLGARAFEEIAGEVVQTTSFVLRNSDIQTYNSNFCRLLSGASQATKEQMFLNREAIFCSNKAGFEKIPGNPVAYWVANRIYSTFDKKLIRDVATASVGIQTGDNNKFLQLWWEIDPDDICFGAACVEDSFQERKWFPYNKGGEYRKWYGNDSTVINWRNDGQDIKNSSEITGHHYQQYADELKFKPLVTWSRISTGVPAFRWKTSGYLSDMAGFSLFAPEQELKKIIGFCNSSVAKYYLDFLAPTLNIMTGSVLSMPYLLPGSQNELCLSVDKCMDLSHEDWDSFEVSWDFKTHPLLKNYGQNNSVLIENEYEKWKMTAKKRFEQLQEEEKNINTIIANAYNLTNEVDVEVADTEVSVRKANLSREIKSLVSYAVGCMFGRYSLDELGLIYPGGEWNLQRYHTFMPDEDNCIPITDEAYFNDDIVGRFCEFIELAFGKNTLEQNLDYIAKALGNKGNTSREVIRNYFLNDFIKDHSSIYSVSGSGKRPIYWLFDSGKQNGFKCLIYMHRYDKDTVGRVRSDYLRKAQDAIEGALKNVEYTIANSTSAVDKAAATKKREKYIKQLNETRTYFQALSHVALQRIEIDLDDGVKTNYAKFQGIEIVDENGKKQKIDLLAKI